MSPSSGQKVQSQTAPERGSAKWIWGVVLAIAVVIAYLPVAWAGFIWDDDLMLTDNGCIIGPFGLKEIWTTNAADICPLTLTTFWAAFKLGALFRQGDFSPAYYHIITLSFHIGAALMLWQVLRRLAVPGAWLGAAIWALHPVQVESVAWIAEMKNPESTLFFLVAIYFFIGSPRGVNAGLPETAGRDYALALAFSALAMGSKTSTAVLPLVLCLAVWWKQGRWNWRMLGRIAPIAVMSLVAALLSVPVQTSHGGEGQSAVLSWPGRFITAGISFWFYLGKLVWPNPLMILYPKWEMHRDWIVSYLPFAAVVLVGFFLWVGRMTWLRPLFFAYAFFVACLFSVMGFFQLDYFRYTLVADHLQYLASMGPLAFVGAVLHRIGTRWLKERPIVRTASAAFVLVALGGMTLGYSRTFKDQFTLWTDEVAKNPDNWLAYNHLGIEYSLQNNTLKALEYLEKSVTLNPGDPNTQNNLGILLAQRGESDAAMSHFHRALEIDPEFGRAHFSTANVLAQQGQLDDALLEYEHALLSNPHEFDIRIGYGNALMRKARYDEARAQFEKALEISPNSPDAHYNLGNLLMQDGHPDEAVAQYQAALAQLPGAPRILNNLAQATAAIGNTTGGVDQLKAAIEKDPKNPTLLVNLARIYEVQDKPDETITQIHKALAISPGYAQAHDLLASALVAKGKIDEAEPEFRKAIELDPKFAKGYADLGYILFHQGKSDEAIGLYNHALELTPSDASLHNNLGIVYAQAGQYPQARAQFAAALKINPDYTEAKNNVQRLEAMAAEDEKSAKGGK